MFEFTLLKKAQGSKARAGLFQTPHGIIETPVFMPVGTKGIVKTLTPFDLEHVGAQIILANTYHLGMRPGTELITRQGGLHEWTTWNKPILTDSGGFQIFSLAALRKISDEGVRFQSHIDGKKFLFTPENVTKMQEELGADIIMAFDECIPAQTSKIYAQQAMERTHQWLERGLKVKKRNDQALFPIIQGGLFDDLRMESARFCSSTDQPGIAIGGLSVGETKQQMFHIIETITPSLPENKPRYLMGVGTPEDIIEAIDHGMDMFDCVQVTRLARHGTVWTSEGKIVLKNNRFREDKKALDQACACYTCQTFTKSYLRHLVFEEEITVQRLLTIHNLHFLLDLMRKIRNAILEDRFLEFKKEFLNKCTIQPDKTL